MKKSIRKRFDYCPYTLLKVGGLVKAVLVCIFLLASFNSFGENKKVNLDLKNTSIKKVLLEIKKQTDFSFLYNNNELNDTKRISVRFNNGTLDDVLKFILKDQNMTYTIENNIISIHKPTLIPSKSDPSQKKTISGIVYDNMDQPIVGSGIVEKGTSNGVITDIDGKFSINVGENAILTISFLGFETREVPIKGRSSIIVNLESDINVLDEIVVVGYGSMNRQAITGSVAKADIDTYREVPTNNILETLKGSVPGLNIGGTSKAGEVGSLSIRGQNSTRDGGNFPLIVLDGAIYDGSLADIPSEDIDSFTVLKDASAAAVYGSRSANGVILIQTKRGRSTTNKPDFNVNITYGISNELKRLKVYDAPGYLQRLLDIRRANGLEADPDKMEFYLQPEEAKNYKATPDHRPTFSDPFELFRQSAYNMRANVSISNSSNFANYYISASLTDQKGVILNDRYKNFTGRINIESDLTSWLKVGVKTNYSIRDYSGDTPNMGQASEYSPYASLYDEYGRYLQYPQTTTSFESPFWSMKTEDIEKKNLLGGILNGKVTVPWIKGLTYEVVYSNTLRWSDTFYFYNEYTTAGQGKNGKGERARENNYNMALDNMVKYNNVFAKKHSVDVTLLYSRERRTWESTKAYAEDFDNTVLGQNKLQDGKKQTVSTGAGESGAIGMMSRITYTFDRRYSLTGTIRRDGCSAFSLNKKWGNFASVGANWNVTNEQFMKAIKPVNNLALRASYGSNGNQSITPYSTLAKVGTNKYIFAGDASYSITQYVSSFALSNLGWEKTTGFNFGLDFGVMNNRLSGSIDAYRTKTTDLLFELSLPSISGKTSMLSNLGEINNRGLEINLHSLNVQVKDFRWHSDFSFALNRNKVVTIYGTDSDGDGKEDDLISSGYFIGRPLGTIYAYKVNGMWQQNDLDNKNIMEGMRPGDYKLEDVDGDEKITSDKDRQFLGTSKENFKWSFTNTFVYKDFSLMVFINSVWGGNNYYLSGGNTPYYDAYINSTAHNRTVYDYWTPNNPDAKYPRPDYADNARYKGTKYIDRSFIKLQKLALTYNMSRLVKSFGFNNMHLTLSADNLLTYAPHWDGLDPETNAGVSKFASPSIRTYQMTLSFNF